MHDNPIYRLQAEEAKADRFILKSVLKPTLEDEFGVARPAPYRRVSAF
jgi:hypothetical protein